MSRNQNNLIIEDLRGIVIVVIVVEVVVVEAGQVWCSADWGAAGPDFTLEATLSRSGRHC